MTRDKKILVGCVVAFVLLGACSCCGIALFVSGAVGAAVGPSMDGTEVGQRATNHEACIAASFARADRCAAMDSACGFDVAAFETGCLAAVPADPTSFCVGSQPGFDDMSASLTFCGQRGREGDFACGVVYATQRDFCEPHAVSVPSP